MVPRTLFSSEHETFRDSVRRFMDEEVKPHDERWQEQGYVDRDVWKKAGANGFLCASMPDTRASVGGTSGRPSLRYAAASSVCVCSHDFSQRTSLMPFQISML